MLDAYVFAVMRPQNNKLAPSLNFFDVGVYCCDVVQSHRNSLKCQTKGRSNLSPLDTGSESNLIMLCRLPV